MSANKPESTNSNGQPQSSNNARGNASTQGMPATRLFKVLNPELYMKPNRLIMYGGAIAMAGIVFWLGSGELDHRQKQQIVDIAAKNGPNLASTQRAPTYQERMAEMKRNSSQ